MFISKRCLLFSIFSTCALSLASHNQRAYDAAQVTCDMHTAGLLFGFVLPSFCSDPGGFRSEPTVRRGHVSFGRGSHVTVEALSAPLPLGHVTHFLKEKEHFNTHAFSVVLQGLSFSFS